MSDSTLARANGHSKASQRADAGKGFARYNCDCPACGKTIAIGSPIRPHKSTGKRFRWAHANCENTSDVVRIKRSDGQTIQVAGELVEYTGPAPEPSSDDKRDDKPAAKVIKIRHPDGSTVEIKGAVHPAFERVLELANARKHIFLPGPSGSGKSHLARQVAEALGLKFGCISCSAGMSESQLLGRMVPQGERGQFGFLGTQFLDCYENGGVFLFDEIDAADSNVLLVVNAALANGHLSVPSRHDKPVAKRHPDFVCIAAANTWGRGADRQYVGRNELDESTLDRFRIGCVPMDYDEGLEAQLCPDRLLYARLRGYRALVQINRLERIVSTRFIAEAYEMVTRWGWTYDRVDEQLFQGWRADEIAKVKGE